MVKTLFNRNFYMYFYVTYTDGFKRVEIGCSPPNFFSRYLLELPEQWCKGSSEKYIYNIRRPLNMLLLCISSGKIPINNDRGSWV